MKSYRRILFLIFFLVSVLFAFPVQAQHVGSNPNDPTGASEQALRNSSGVTGYRSAAEYLEQSAKDDEKDRAEREKRMKAMENYGDPMAPVGQSFGQEYTKPPYNGR